MGKGRLRWVGPLAALMAVLGLVARSSAVPEDGKPDTGVSQPKAPREARKLWEYSQVSLCPNDDGPRASGFYEDKLNEQGERGWELVALTSRFPTPRPECFIATFKRERLR
jgi:Domain of unknown function (DUF4177)